MAGAAIKSTSGDSHGSAVDFTGGGCVREWRGFHHFHAVAVEVDDEQRAKRQRKTERRVRKNERLRGVTPGEFVKAGIPGPGSERGAGRLNV